jgi:hypothetical protein
MVTSATASVQEWRVSSNLASPLGSLESMSAIARFAKSLGPVGEDIFETTFGGISVTCAVLREDSVVQIWVRPRKVWSTRAI